MFHIALDEVALLTESVDRNKGDMNQATVPCVALLTESVDRNLHLRLLK